MITKFNIVRVLRIIAGVGLLVQGITYKENLPLLLGGMLFFQGAFNVGCCGANCATIPSTSKEVKKNQSLSTISFEEIK
jgi:hypothetical protein